MLNGEVAHAGTGVQGAVPEEGFRGAGGKAAGAAAAAARVEGGGLHLQGGEEDADKGVDPEGLGEEVAAFPDPARPGEGGEGALGQGPVVHVALGL